MESTIGIQAPDYNGDLDMTKVVGWTGRSDEVGQNEYYGDQMISVK